MGLNRGTFPNIVAYVLKRLLDKLIMQISGEKEAHTVHGKFNHKISDFQQLQELFTPMWCQPRKLERGKSVRGGFVNSTTIH